VLVEQVFVNLVETGHLRHKLEEEPASPRCPLTEIGVGYRLAAE